MLRAIIFDLDNCLSAADEIPPRLYAAAYEAIRRANRGTVSDEKLEQAFSDSWRIPFDEVARRHGFSDEMRAAGWNAFASMEVTTAMCGYPDLKALEELPVQRFLVTSGFRSLQESKIRALGFEHLFSAIHVDAIDEPGRRGKEAIFRKILARHQLRPEEVLVVGDSSESEIAAGNRIGCSTVQILRPGVPKGMNADHFIESLAELRELVRENM